jgi:hypothetical protein
MTEFRFTDEHSRPQVSKIIDFLRRPRLFIPTAHDYPNFDLWLAKAEAEIIDSTKHAMIGMEELAIRAVVAGQRHKERSGIYENTQYFR